MYVYDCQVHSCINIFPFDLVLNWKIPDIKMQSIMFPGKMLSHAEQRAVYLATMHH